MKLEKLLQKLDDYDEVIMECFDKLEETSLEYFDTYINGHSGPEMGADGNWFIHIDVKVPIGRYEIKTVKKVKE